MPIKIFKMPRIIADCEFKDAYKQCFEHFIDYFWF